MCLALVHLIEDQVCYDNSLASLIGRVEDEALHLRSLACMIWLGTHPETDILVVGAAAPSDC